MSRYRTIQGLVAGVALLVAFGGLYFAEDIGQKTVAIALLAAPWLAIALVALRGETFTFFGGGLDEPRRAMVWPLLLLPAFGLFPIAEEPDNGPPFVRLFLLTLIGGPVMTAVCAALCHELRWRWGAIAGILALALVYVYDGLRCVNSLFDRGILESEMVQIESVYISDALGPDGRPSLQPYFQVRSLDDVDDSFRVAVSREWYARKKQGDVVCLLHHPGALGATWSTTSECAPSAVFDRRQYLQKYGVDYATDLLRSNARYDLRLQLRVADKVQAELASLNGTEPRRRVETKVHAVLRSEGFPIENRRP